MEKYENTSEIIAGNLIYYRKKAGLTQIQLAEKLHYSDKSISKWERGESVPDILIFLQLAKLYGLSINDFVTKRKKERIANIYFSKVMISLLSIALIALISTIVFVSLTIFTELQNIWITYLFGGAIICIVMIIFDNLFFRRLYNILYTSILCWLSALILYLLFRHIEYSSYIFMIAIPLQIFFILLYIFLYKRKKA